MQSWHWSRGQKFREAKKNYEKTWDTKEVLKDDPRLGKRVFCLFLLPEIETYGTIQTITHYYNELPSQGIESWKVLTDTGMELEEPSAYFELYQLPIELHAGDWVRYRLEEGNSGGYWEASILRAQCTGTTEQLGFVIRIENGQDFSTVKSTKGQELPALPYRLTKQ